MPKAYPDELRQKAVEAIAAGETYAATAAALGVSISAVVKWTNRHRTTGTAAARPSGRRDQRRWLEPHREWLLERLRQQPGTSLKTLAHELGKRGVQTSHVSVWRLLRDAGVTFR
ncbi:helix-turn-helix domain-containing protein [uncultured Sphingomonas sp.]|uniref:helix-turn-helix domain-containing protein n=1 Tax=uncultured Sphingomonas sp. TaxID=158754 RepID=UPI0025EF5ACF|nr:helix-turn-helix domain-containing protein [uncultured Sphingomonas sp.]